MTEATDFKLLRDRMVSEQLEKRGITDKLVLEAMRDLPREEFVPDPYKALAYEDKPLPLGPDQTISQPYIVAYMVQEVHLNQSDKVLEIGSGSGYLAAILAKIVDKVYSVELDPKLVEQASEVYVRLGITNVNIRCGDGFAGWKEQAPFDAIIMSACPDSIPRDLVKQLKIGGRMILPLGVSEQTLVYLEKTQDALISKDLGEVRFVGMKTPN